MLAPERDDDPPPAEADRKASFNLWLSKCEEYAALSGLTVVRHGIAPKDYPTALPATRGPGSFPAGCRPRRSG